MHDLEQHRAPPTGRVAAKQALPVARFRGSPTLQVALGITVDVIVASPKRARYAMALQVDVIA